MTAIADIERYQAAARRVGDMILAYQRLNRHLPLKVRIPRSEEKVIGPWCKKLDGVRQTPEGPIPQMCGLDLEFHDGQGWEVTR